MANASKQGIDYFSLSVDFLDDIKIRKIMRTCGTQAISILIGLLSRIYRFDGYFVDWNEDVCFEVADQIGAKEALVEEVVKRAVDVGFFDPQIFRDKNILTSQGIQKRFFEATIRRKQVFYDATLILNFQNVNKNGIDVCIMNKNVDRMKQSKVKESKVKESKEDICRAHGSLNNVRLTDEEFCELKTKFPDYQDRIESLSLYMGSTGKTYKSHYLTILSWARRDRKKPTSKTGAYVTTDTRMSDAERAEWMKSKMQASREADLRGKKE